MTIQEFLRIKSRDYITIDQLRDRSDRTLLYGWYSSDVFSPNTIHHIYIKDGKMYEVKYHSYNEITLSPYELEQLNLSRKMYKGYTLNPNGCDYEFCALLLDKGVKLEFRYFSYQEDELKETYYGRIS